MSGCCATGRPFDVHACFQRGLVTRRQPPLDAGEAITSASGLWARFSMELDESRRVADVRFDCSTCTTLIAYCQALAELARGAGLDRTEAFGTEWLVSQLPGVPAPKQDRAVLATAAFRAAALTAAGHGLQQREVQG